MSTPKILGQVVLKFPETGDPITEFSGAIDMLNIQAGIYAIRTRFQLDYLTPIGEKLRKEADLKAAAEKAKLETKAPTEPNKKVVS